MFFIKQLNKNLCLIWPKFEIKKCYEKVFIICIGS